MKNLIVNADDFGMDSLVNEAILKGHTHGIITSTSLVASGDAYEEAVMEAKNCPNLGIGIHLTLVGGLQPVSKAEDIPSLLTKDGVFVDDHVEFIKRVYAHKINFNEVYHELNLQCNKILNSALQITHVDGHQHLHVLPEILPIVITLMKKYGLNKLRTPKEPYLFFNNNKSLSRIIGKMGLSYLATLAKKKTATFYFRTPRYFWGMMNGGNMTEENLMAILSKANTYEGSHEIMVHPGMNNTVLDNKYHWHYHWEEEYKALTSLKVKEYLFKNNFRLINYGDLT